MASACFLNCGRRSESSPGAAARFSFFGPPGVAAGSMSSASFPDRPAYYWLMASPVISVFSGATLGWIVRCVRFCLAAPESDGCEKPVQSIQSWRPVTLTRRMKPSRGRLAGSSPPPRKGGTISTGHRRLAAASTTISAATPTSRSRTNEPRPQLAWPGSGTGGGPAPHLDRGTALGQVALATASICSTVIGLPSSAARARQTTRHLADHPRADGHCHRRTSSPQGRAMSSATLAERLGSASILLADSGADFAELRIHTCVACGDGQDRVIGADGSPHVDP
jgi:hypothetical protein